MTKRKKLKKALVVVAALILLFFVLKIRVKEAIEIEISSEYTSKDINTFVGKKVTLLCEYSDHEVTELPDYEFIIIGIANNEGVFEPLPITQGVPGLNVYPKCFIGRAIKRYNYGFINYFVFQGIINEDNAKNRRLISDFRINLDSWDIVYPIFHWEYLLLNSNETYKRSILVIDYLIP